MRNAEKFFRKKAEFFFEIFKKKDKTRKTKKAEKYFRLNKMRNFFLSIPQNYNRLKSGIRI